MIIDPLGDVLAHSTDVEATIRADVSVPRVQATRAEFPFLQDRRSRR
jgi:predicted amidohydrolase